MKSLEIHIILLSVSNSSNTNIIETLQGRKMRHSAPQRRVSEFLKVKSIPHIALITWLFYVQIYYIRTKAIPVKLLERFPNSGPARGSPVPTHHETLVISHIITEVQLSLASEISTVTFTLICLSLRKAETGIY